MTRILVLYASTHGHTGKIAARIAEAIGPAAELRRPTTRRGSPRGSTTPSSSARRCTWATTSARCWTG